MELDREHQSSCLIPLCLGAECSSGDGASWRVPTQQLQFFCKIQVQITRDSEVLSTPQFTLIIIDNGLSMKCKTNLCYDNSLLQSSVALSNERNLQQTMDDVDNCRMIVDHLLMFLNYSIHIVLFTD